MAFRANFPGPRVAVGDSLFSAAGVADTHKGQVSVADPTVFSAVPQLGTSRMQESHSVETSVGPLPESRFVRVKRTSSTMDLAARLAREGAPHGLVVVADEQTAGRGRHGREWVAAPGRDLLTSILFRPRPALLQEVQFVAALAAVETISTTTGHSPKIKWPNDICVEGKKVCGILVESHEDSQGLAAVAGFGLNLYTSNTNHPDLPPVASLSELAGRNIDRDSTLKILVQNADVLYEKVTRGDSLIDEWSTLVDTVGQQVRRGYWRPSKAGSGGYGDCRGNRRIRSIIGP